MWEKKTNLTQTLLQNVFCVTDEFRKVKKYHQESVKAEEKCNATVAGPLSPVEQSNKTRSLIKDLLDASQDKLLRDLAAQNKSLSELQGKAQDLDRRVRRLTQKVSARLSLRQSCG